MNKMWVLATVIVITIIAVLILYFSSRNHKQISSAIKNSIEHPELGNIPLPDSSPPELKRTRNNINKNEDVNNHSKVQLQPTIIENEQEELSEDMKISVLQDIESGKLIYDSGIEAGFSEEGAENIASKNPENLLYINDMPIVLQESIREELKKIREYGYQEVEDKYSDEIIRIIDYISENHETTPENINFTLSDMPESITKDYKYVGHVFPNQFITQSEDGSYDSIRRVYKSADSDHLIIVEETSLKSGSANLIAEFVNTNVNEYPAIYSVKSTQSGETYSMLNWSTQDYAYSLYQVGLLDDETSSRLGSMAISITEANQGQSESEQKERRSIPEFTDSPPEL